MCSQTTGFEQVHRTRLESPHIEQIYHQSVNSLLSPYQMYHNFSSGHILPGSLVYCIQDPQMGNTLFIPYIVSSSTVKTILCMVSFLYNCSLIPLSLINTAYGIFTNRILLHGSYRQTRLRQRSPILFYFTLDHWRWLF